MDELMNELFEGWKKGKTEEEIANMKQRMNAIKTFEEWKGKKMILSLYLDVPFDRIRYEEDEGVYLYREEKYCILNENERMLDIQAAVMADLGSTVFDYEFLAMMLKIEQEELKKNATNDYIIGGTFPRDYLLLQIEKTCGMKIFITTLIDRKMIPNYHFLENQIHSGQYYIEKV